MDSIQVKRSNPKDRRGKRKRARRQHSNADTSLDIASASQEQNKVPTANNAPLSKNQRLAKNRVWKHFDRFEKFEDPNPLFSTYYKHQLTKDLNSPSEWKAFTESLARGLPVTFRICVLRAPTIAKTIQSKLERGAFQRSPYHVETDGSTCAELIKQLPFFGEEADSHKTFLWQLNVNAKELAKGTLLRPLRDFLTAQVKLGNITRQACASMIPAVVLKVEPGHRVVDMCSAPGSKTDQLLQSVTSSPKLTDGFVIANDSDPKRLGTLQRRLAGSPSPNLVITCATAQDLASRLGANSIDRIICDVPCTGDGTVRKYPYLLKRWGPARAVHLHPLQLDIAMAAASLLRVGGRMVYSTCSLNPVEDEAVVAALLASAGGSLRVLPALAPGFKCRAGISTWDCSTARLSGQDNESELEIPDTVQPPSSPTILKSLKHCMRVLPHDQDTGGFFYALIEKVAEFEVSTGVDEKIHLEQEMEPEESLTIDKRTDA